MVNRKRALRALSTTGAIVGVVLAVIAVSSTHRSDQPSSSTGNRPARAVSTTSTPQPPATGSASPRGALPQDAAPNADRLLPFTGRQITAAADLATRFTAAYASHRFDEPPQTYLDRLTPMISTQLQPVITQTATDPATLEQRRQRREVTTAQARAEAIRTLGPTSITLLLTATTHTTKQQTTTGQPAGQQAIQRQTTRRETTRYAVTVVPHDGGWRVYAIELAATGDTGAESGSGGEANRP
jgi:hypothetical protein